MPNVSKTFLAAGFVLFGIALEAQPDRIHSPIDSTGRVTLAGHVRTLAASYVDEGPVPASQQMEGLVLFLKPSGAQKLALDQLLIDLQDPDSKQYHQWLTPEEYAERFGVSASDGARITAWLTAQGLHVGQMGRARSWIVFDGTAGSVEAAFQAEVHSYRSATAAHYANTANPTIPAALEDVVRSIGGLHDFVPQPNQPPSPEYTTPTGTNELAPGDLATIYDFAPLLANGIDGTGQSMVVIGESSPSLSDIQQYRSLFGLPSPTIQVILTPNFADPGQVTAELAESNGDLDAAMAVARNASILYVYSTSALNAITYAVDQNLAPVIAENFTTGCDSAVTALEKTTYQGIAQQGNAQGITWVDHSGNVGPAGCEKNGATFANNGLATLFPADIPEVTAVGGTEFNEQGGAYWSAGNAAAGGSAVSYIPEMVWNDSSTTGLAASGGGASAFFAKPAWQTGPGVPQDGQRDVPDVALSNSAIHDPYYYISGGKAGTSASTSSAFAGMVVLLNHYLVTKGIQGKPGLGNLNALLYRLAQSNPAAFHDITVGSNMVPCTIGTPNCTTGQMGYTAGPGYDLCTGLGSVDVANLAAALAANPPGGSSIVVSSNANPVYQTQPDANGNSWHVTLTLTELGGVSTTLTGVSIDGTNSPVSNWFTNPAIAALGSAAASVSLEDTQIPQAHTFGFTGMDASGRVWTTQFSVPFAGFAASSNGPVPAIQGTANGASFAASYAPGMILSIFGAELGASTQIASTVPLLTYMQNFEATVNGVLTPLYYVSAAQVNAQIPYGTAPGPATLVVYQGGQSASMQIQISAAAPGIFADGNGNTVPYAGGSAGQTLLLFVTGDGEVSPPVATGTAPPVSTPITSLPKSVLPLSMTIGGQPAQIVFDGIPYGLVGATQLNFVVPSGLAPGPQPMVVTVGTQQSKPATFTITQ